MGGKFRPKSIPWAKVGRFLLRVNALVLALALGAAGAATAVLGGEPFNPGIFGLDSPTDGQVANEGMAPNPLSSPDTSGRGARADGYANLSRPTVTSGWWAPARACCSDSGSPWETPGEASRASTWAGMGPPTPPSTSSFGTSPRGPGTIASRPPPGNRPVVDPEGGPGPFPGHGAGQGSWGQELCPVGLITGQGHGVPWSPGGGRSP